MRMLAGCMPTASPEMQMPMRVSRLAMRVRMSIQLPAERNPEAERAERDQQHAANHFTSALEEHGDLPAKQDDRDGADEQQQRVTERKSQGDAHRVHATV